MECLWEAYADGAASADKSASHKVNFVEDVNSDGDRLAKEKTLRDAKFDEALLKFYMSNGVYNRHSVVVITKKLDLNAQQLPNWEANVNRRGKGLDPLFVHILTDSNIQSSQLRITKKIFEVLKLEPSGVAVLRSDKKEDVKGTFSPASVGRILISFDAWAKFASENGLKEGHVVMFLFHTYDYPFEARRGITIAADVI